jgi:hypothetical protein
MLFNVVAIKRIKSVLISFPLKYFFILLNCEKSHYGVLDLIYL